MGRKYVLDGAIVECNMGMAPAKLVVTTNQRVKIQGKFKATHMDRLVSPTFIQCKLKPTPGGFLPCTPILLPWQKAAKKTNLRGILKFIYDDSYCMCGTGGKITVVHPMQINAAGAAFEQYTNISTTIPGAMPLAGFDEGTLPEEDSSNGFLDGLQTALDIAGLVPGFGEIADGINAAIYVARGDYANAALSAAAMIPIGGQAATLAKLGMKGADAAKTVIKNADEVADVAQAATKVVKEKAAKEVKEEVAKETKEKAVKEVKEETTKEAKEKTAKETKEKAAREKATCLDDPINVSTGEVVGRWTDFELPGIIPFKWERMYYSQMEYHGNFGHRWQGGYEQYLEIYTDAIYYCTGAGHIAFPAIKDGKSYYNRQEKMTLKRINGAYTIYHHKERLTYRFRHYADENKQLITSISNVNGHAIHFKYDNTRLLQIIDSAGRILDIETDYLQRVTGIIHKETTQQTRLMTYEYDDNSDLVKTTNAVGKSERMYYVNHLIQTRTNRNGVTFNWRYDGIDALAKCTKTWGDANKLSGNYTYLNDTKTIHTNSLGHQTTYVHHKGIVWEEISEEGHIRKKQYNEYTELVKETDELGRSIQYKYDNRGNQIAVIYPDNTTVKMEYADDRLTALTNQNGTKWIWKYNKNDELEARITPGGATTHFEYRQGILKKVTDVKGQSIKFEHDKQYNLIETTYFNNQKNTWEYDSRGNCVKATDTRGNISQYDYDLLGRMTQIHQADGNITKLKYDAYDGVLRATDSQRDVKFEYTELGNLKSRTEKGRTIQFSYNTDEQLTFIRNEKNNVYRFHRNSKGQVVEEIGFDGLTRKYLRDAAGQVNTIIRPNDKVINYKYDDNGRMYKVEHSDGSEEFYGYDKAGHLIEAVNENATITFKRDSLGRVIEETQNGYTVNSQYDLNGRSQITSSLGASIRLAHDEQHGFINTVRANHDARSIWETQIKRDAAGLEIERLLPGAVRSTLERDNTGKIIQHNVNKTQQVLRQKHYTWDINNRLKSIFDGITEGQIGFNHDSFGNLIGATYPDGQELFKTSDEVGNLFKTKDQSDRMYDTGGRLMRSPEWKYQYDEEGNLIRKTNRKTKESWQYEWNVSGMLKEVVRPDKKKVTFKYDALGRRIQKTFEDNSTQWVWNGNVPLHEWTQTEEKEAYIVNNEGEINTTIPENLTTWVFEENSFVPMAKIKGAETYSIITDYLGTPTEMYDSEGNQTWACDLDIYGKVRILEGEAADCPFRYQGQYEDVETGLYYNRFRYYSVDEGSYISQDRLRLAGGSKLYQYSSNTTLILDPFGLMDFYHATNSPQATAAVIGGIDPSKGRPNLDFNPSGKGGFYVTNDLAQAQSWAKNGGSVIHFDVPEEELASLNIKTFDGATDEWGDFVKQGRKGTLVHNYDAVDGPMIALSKSKKGKAKPVTLQPDGRLGHQLAIFSDEGAELFDKHNKGVVPCS